MKPKQLELLLETNSSKQLESLLETNAASKKQYYIPGMTENPAVSYGMLRRWIIDFCDKNNLDLPRYFYKKDKRQLQGMFYGMLRHYKISLEDIIPHFF